MWLLWADTSPYVWNKRDSEWWELLLFASTPPINVETSFCLRQYLLWMMNNSFNQQQKRLWVRRPSFVSNKRDYEWCRPTFVCYYTYYERWNSLLFATEPNMNDVYHLLSATKATTSVQTSFCQQQKVLCI